MSTSQSIHSKNISGIYIHFPFCKIKCGYCDFYSIADREESIPIFIDSLLKEFELYFQCHDISTLEFDSIFLGGGSPSLITSQDIDRILEALDREEKEVQEKVRKRERGKW